MPLSIAKSPNLEKDLRPILHDSTWIVTIKPSEATIGHVVVRNGAFSMVPEVEEFESELKPNRFGHCRCLEQRQVGIPDRRPSEGIAPQASVLNHSACRIGRQSCDSYAGREGSSIHKPSCWNIRKWIPYQRGPNETAVTNNSEWET